MAISVGRHVVAPAGMSALNMLFGPYYDVDDTAENAPNIGAMFGPYDPRGDYQGQQAGDWRGQFGQGSGTSRTSGFPFDQPGFQPPPQLGGPYPFGEDQRGGGPFPGGGGQFATGPNPAGPGGTGWMQSFPGFWNQGSRGNLMSRGAGFGPSNSVSLPVNMAMYGQGGAMNRYADAEGSFNRNFATDLTDANGNVIAPSVQRSSGERSFQNYGGFGAGGNQWAPHTGSTYDTNTAFRGQAAQSGNLLDAQYAGAQNPALNADWQAGRVANAQGNPVGEAIGQGMVNDISGYGAMTRGLRQNDPSFSSGWQAQRINEAQSGPGGASIGAGMVDQLKQLRNAYTSNLNNAIDEETQETLNSAGPEALAAAAAAGMGRSGQSQSGMHKSFRNIMDSSNRMKQGILSEADQAAMERVASGIMEGGRFGFEESEMKRNRLGQAYAQGADRAFGKYSADLAGDQAIFQELSGARREGGRYGFEEAEQARNRLAQAYGQGGDRAMGKYNTDTGNFMQRYGIDQDMGLRSLLGADSAALNRQTAQSAEQSRGMRDYMDLYGFGQNQRKARYGEFMDLNDRYRAEENERYNQQIQFGQMPYSMLMQLATGVTPTMPTAGRTNPWETMAANTVGNALGGAPDYFNRLDVDETG